MTVTRETIEHFYKDLGFSVKGSYDLLRQALLHPSYANEFADGSQQSNQRLEFLGDSILGAVVAEMLYKRCPELPEGELTKLRAALVNRDTLADIAIQLGLPGVLLLGRGEKRSRGQGKNSILAAAFEAVIGAIFLRFGYEECQKFVREHLVSQHVDLESMGGGNFKAILQEYTQRETGGLPWYDVVESWGPDHDKTFVVEVRVGSTVSGRGVGKKIKEAQQNAARDALGQIEENAAGRDET